MKKKVISLLLTIALLFSVTALMAVEVAAAPGLTASEDCIALLKQMEGFIAKPVWDYSQYSVGYGSRVEKDSEEYTRYMEEGITEEEADALLRTYVALAEKDINKLISSARFENEFTSAGINQTNHRIVLHIDVSVAILLPGFTTATKVSTAVTVAETVIVGGVPDTYTYFSTTPDIYEDDVKDYILNNS